MSGLGGARHDRDLVRDIRILRGRGLTMAQVAERLGISRATAYRILKEQQR